MNILSGKISKGTIKLVSLIDALESRKKDCKIVRHRVAGDIVGDVPDTLEECKTVEAMGLTNIGYTHHWRSDEAQPLRKYFRASCESMKDVLEARKMGWAAALIVPKDTPRKMKLENGETAYTCPARHGIEGKKDITCNTCTLCKVGDRTSHKTVMFPVHGNAATLKKINQVIK